MKLNLTVAAFTLTIQLAPVVPACASEKVELLVPAYFYPSSLGSDWNQLTTAAAAGTPIVAIVNPDSGPGTAANPDYASAITKFRTAGGTVLGYVSSGYTGMKVTAGSSCAPAGAGSYSVASIVSCAAHYKQFYGVDGIFVDEMGQPAIGAPQATVNAFYTQVYNGLKGIDSNWTVFGNPGQNAPQSLLRTGSSGGADTLVTFEGTAASFTTNTPSAYASSFPAGDFANIIHTAGADYDLSSAIALVASRNVGYFYATNLNGGGGNNPYSALPSYWSAEVSAVRAFDATPSVPEPSTWFQMIVGFSAIGIAQRLGQRRARSKPGALRGMSG